MSDGRLDRATLAAVPSRRLAAWLEATGWTLVRIDPDRAAYYERPSPEAEPFEALVPLRESLRDYHLRVGELLVELAAIEGRPVRAVLDDVLAGPFAPRPDVEVEGMVVQISRENPTAGGTITLAAVVDGAVRRIRLELGVAEYPLAIRAHTEGTRLYCEGEPVREGRGFLLRAPRQVSLRGDG